MPPEGVVLVEAPAPIVIAPAETPLVMVPVPHVTVIAAGDQGPAGRDGAAGSGAVQVVLQATSALGGQRVVSTAADGALVYADPTDLATLEGLFGLTLNAAAPGDDVTVLVSGEAQDSGWAWVQGAALYLGVNGVLTQTPPAGAYIVRLGHAVSATQILFRLREPVVLA